MYALMLLLMSGGAFGVFGANTDYCSHVLEYTSLQCTSAEDSSGKKAVLLFSSLL